MTGQGEDICDALPLSIPARYPSPMGKGKSGPLPKNNPAQKETNHVKRRRPPTRVILKAAAVWELLDQLDLSQNELARRCRITSGHLSHLMNGRRSPSPGVRRRLMEALGVDDFHRLFIIMPVEVGDGGSRE